MCPDKQMQVSRRSQVDPFIVMDVMESAAKAEAQGRHIIHMEVGQPGTPAPQGARDALATAMEREALGYTTALGLPALREKIAALYDKWYGVALSPDRTTRHSGCIARACLVAEEQARSGAPKSYRCRCHCLCSHRPDHPPTILRR